MVSQEVKFFVVRVVFEVVNIPKWKDIKMNKKLEKQKKISYKVFDGVDDLTTRGRSEERR